MCPTSHLFALLGDLVANTAPHTLLFGIERDVAVMNGVFSLLYRTSLVLGTRGDVLGLDVHALDHAFASARHNFGDCPDCALVLSSDNLRKRKESLQFVPT